MARGRRGSVRASDLRTGGASRRTLRCAMRAGARRLGAARGVFEPFALIFSHASSFRAAERARARPVAVGSAYASAISAFSFSTAARYSGIVAPRICVA